MKAFIIIIICFFNLYSFGQRRNNHKHFVQIDRTLLIDYLKFIDQNLNDQSDTILIRLNLDDVQFENINVKHVTSPFSYALGSKANYIIIHSEQHFENDSTIFIRNTLKKKCREKEKGLFRRNYTVLKPILDTKSNLSKDYYISFNSGLGKWAIRDDFKLDFAYHGKYGIVMDSTTVGQFLEELKGAAVSKNYISSVTTEGQVSFEWLSRDDLELLISLIDSKEPAKCIARSISSRRVRSGEVSTIGNHVTHIFTTIRKSKIKSI